MLRAYVEENEKQRERLRGLVALLTDQDLASPLYEGWTLAAILAHMAFWDYRALLLLRKWKQEGVNPSPADVHLLNDAMRSLLNAIPPRRAAEFAVEAAVAVDTEIENLDPGLLSQIEVNPSVLRLDRGHHRRAHIDQIESALKAKR
jgi:hypothetical protein